MASAAITVPVVALFYLSALCHGPLIVEAVLLSSNVEDGGRHIACLGQEVVLTCTGEHVSSLRWDSESFQPQEPVGFTVFDPLGDMVNRIVFIANLTYIDPDEDSSHQGTIISTLTGTADASLDGAVVECSSGGQTDTITLTVIISGADRSQTVCPGESTKFTCTVIADDNTRATIWAGDSRVFSGCPGGILPLLHLTGQLVMLMCGLATGTLYPPVGNSYTSDMTIVPTAELGGSEFMVKCAYPSLDNFIMNWTIFVSGPPSFRPTLTVNGSDIVRVGMEEWRFDLVWEVPLDDCGLTYIINIDPLLPPLRIETCNGNCFCDFQCHRITLGLNDPRNITVVAQSCDRTQNSSESDPLHVEFVLPNAPMDVYSTLNYHKTDLDGVEKLASIALSWPPVMDPPDPAMGVDGSVTGYQISAIDMDPVCVPRCSEACSYVVDVVEDSSTEYTVSLAAMNVLGLGAAAMLGPYKSLNELMRVHIQYCSSISTAEVQCSFPSDVFTSDYCTVKFTTAFSTSFELANTAHVLHTERLIPGTLYNYTISARNDTLKLEVVIEGTLFTDELGCDPKDLGVPDEEADSECRKAAYLGGVRLESGRGRVCYSSTSPGSTVAYVCENGYTGNSSSLTVCDANCMWMNIQACIAFASPPDPDANLDNLSEDGRSALYSCDSALYELDGTCSIEYDDETGWPDAPRCKAVGWIVFLIFLVLLQSLVIAVLIAALIYIIIALKRKHGIASLGGPKEVVELKENMSYGPVKVQPPTPAEEPVYEDANITQPPGEVHTGGNVAYGHICS